MQNQQQSDCRRTLHASVSVLLAILLVGCAKYVTPGSGVAGARADHSVGESLPHTPGDVSTALGISDLAGLRRNLVMHLGREWRARVVESGPIGPAGLREGVGLHILADVDPWITPSNPTHGFHARAIHIWLMSSAYVPLRATEELGPLTIATYLGRSTGFRAFYLKEEDKGDTRLEAAVGGHLHAGLGINLAVNFRTIRQDLLGDDLKARQLAIDEFFLFTAYDYDNDAFLANAVNRNLATWEMAAQDRRCWPRLDKLYDESTFLFYLPRVNFWRDNGALRVHGILLDAVKRRPDLTDALYRSLAEHLDRPGQNYANVARLGRLMAPPSRQTLRSALVSRYTQPARKPSSEPDISALRIARQATAQLHMMAVEHALGAGYPGLTYEIVSLADPPIKMNYLREAREYMHRCQDESTAPDWFRAVSDGGATIEFESASIGEHSVEEWTRRGYPWRGDLNLFDSLPTSTWLKTMVLKYLRARTATSYDRRSRQHQLDILALSFFIREPVREALPYILEMLQVEVRNAPLAIAMAAKREGPATSYDEETFYKWLVLNPENRTDLYAAQGVIRLGSRVSSDVLDYVRRRITEVRTASSVSGAGEVMVHKRPSPGRRSVRIASGAGSVLTPLSDIDLCVLILGFFADQRIRSDLEELKQDLVNLPSPWGAEDQHSVRVWEIAKVWYQSEGRKLPPLVPHGQ